MTGGIFASYLCIIECVLLGLVLSLVKGGLLELALEIVVSLPNCDRK